MDGAARACGAITDRDEERLGRAQRHFEDGTSEKPSVLSTVKARMALKELSVPLTPF